MPGPYTQEQIENWVGDFCQSDYLDMVSPELREVAGQVLVTFLAAACAVRDAEPADIDEQDAKAALLGPVAKLSLPEGVRSGVPALCGGLLGWLEAEGRLGGGAVMGAYVRARGAAFLEAAGGKQKPATRAGAKIGRNDPCPCGSGKKYKKCCLGE